MRALLDVNVLIALMDAAHVFHARAHAHWSKASKNGWASCPITENGMVRVMSHAGYSQSRQFSAHDLIEALRTFVAGTDHEFWPDDISLRDARAFDSTRILGSKQQTDLYLLALAVRHGGVLTTFDGNIALAPVVGAAAANLCVV
jgi:hypothetical protein